MKEKEEKYSKDYIEYIIKDIISTSFEREFLKKFLTENLDQNQIDKIYKTNGIISERNKRIDQEVEYWMEELKRGPLEERNTKGMGFF